ncbi:mitochondrial import inner membrane translocase subunit Tim10 isoform X2 [Harpegnathos saltator]|uniref:mitochondrial import inner membrane translocase subunit Tim10 isoform X2 n=1 Tax=Harpegnathos saltator TaxID=610380 RepID=UPI0005907B47|nr:mitochondrial import inner membrane translocase subunit Tim10 isoform X2 [Harpegnathos saltator]
MATLPQLDEDKLKKCITPKYTEPELGKGESICLDRCIAKYLDVHERIGKKLTQFSMQEAKLQEQPKTS